MTKTLFAFIGFAVVSQVCARTVFYTKHLPGGGKMHVRSSVDSSGPQMRSMFSIETTNHLHPRSVGVHDGHIPPQYFKRTVSNLRNVLNNPPQPFSSGGIPNLFAVFGGNGGAMANQFAGFGGNGGAMANQFAGFGGNGDAMPNPFGGPFGR